MDAKLQHLTDKVLQGEEINRQEAEWLTQIDIEELAQGADRIRQESCLLYTSDAADE